MWRIRVALIHNLQKEEEEEEAVVAANMTRNLRAVQYILSYQVIKISNAGKETLT